MNKRDVLVKRVLDNLPAGTDVTAGSVIRSLVEALVDAIVTSDEMEQPQEAFLD